MVQSSPSLRDSPLRDRMTCSASSSVERRIAHECIVQERSSFADNDLFELARYPYLPGGGRG